MPRRKQKQIKQKQKQSQTIIIDQSRRTVRTAGSAPSHRPSFYPSSGGSTVVMPPSYPNPYASMFQQMKQPYQIKELAQEVSKELSKTGLSAEEREYVRNARAEWLQKQQPQPPPENSVAVGDFDDFNDFPMEAPILPSSSPILDSSVRSVPPPLSRPASQLLKPEVAEMGTLSQPRGQHREPRGTLSQSVERATQTLRTPEQPDIERIKQGAETKAQLENNYIQTRARQYMDEYDAEGTPITDLEARQMARKDLIDQKDTTGGFKKEWDALNAQQVRESRQRKKKMGK